MTTGPQLVVDNTKPRYWLCNREPKVGDFVFPTRAYVHTFSVPGRKWLVKSPVRVTPGILERAKNMHAHGRLITLQRTCLVPTEKLTGKGEPNG